MRRKADWRRTYCCRCESIAAMRFNNRHYCMKCFDAIKLAQVEYIVEALRRMNSPVVATGASQEKE